MDISLIWAMTENRVIGRDNDLPWSLPEDMRHFMRTTKGKPVVMGRKTFESMPSALPGRANIVITRDTTWTGDQAIVVHSLDEGVAHAREVCERDGLDEIMIGGGADIYARALDQATKLYLTQIHAEVEGDTFFPEFDLGEWQLVEETTHPQDERHWAAFSIRTYVRKSA